MQFSPQALDDRPELAVGIAKVSAAWSGVEVVLGLLLAMMLDTEAKAGVSMYLALVGSASQTSVLIGAAEARLTKELQEELASLLQRVRRRAGERNYIVHALWGAPESMPDKIVNCQPDNLVRDVADKLAIVRAIGYVSDHPSDEFVDNLRSYTKKDFDDIFLRIKTLETEIVAFTFRVSAAHAQRRALIAELMKPPRSREGEPPLGAVRQTSHEEPSQSPDEADPSEGN